MAWVDANLSFNDHQTMYSAFLDELQKSAQRIGGIADDHTGEVSRPLRECLSDGQIQGMVGAQAHECLGNQSEDSK